MTLLLEVGTFVGESTRVGGESALISSLLLLGIGPRRPVPSPIYLAYRRGAKFRVAYQEAQGYKQGFWPLPSLIDLAYHGLCSVSNSSPYTEMVPIWPDRDQLFTKIETI